MGVPEKMQRTLLLGVVAALLVSVNFLVLQRWYRPQVSAAVVHVHTDGASTSIDGTGYVQCNAKQCEEVCNAKPQSSRTTKGRLQQKSDRAPKTSYDTMQFLEEVVLPSIDNAGTDIDRPPIWASQYLTEPSATNATFKEYRTKVAEHIISPGFQQRWNDLRASSAGSGIVIAAGGRYYLPQALVLLRVLRHELLVRLPVELFWHGEEEMDAKTLQAMKAEFAPLEGFDVTKLPYPGHHLPGAKLKGFPIKAYALLHSRFQEVLLLDCDVVLARDPSFMFGSHGFRARGNWFWSDIYSEGMVDDKVYEYVGLNKSVVKPALDLGKRDFVRHTESGQLMINRTMHLDVLEWVWFLNAFGDGHMCNFMYGDKDTYGLAFGLAGKAHMYQHLNLPPAGIFTHADNLGWKPTNDKLRKQFAKQGNWWMHGLVHYGDDDAVLLVHRVTGELQLGAQTPRDQVITPPISQTWSMWFMGHGPSNKVADSLRVQDIHLEYDMHTASLGSSGVMPEECPLAVWSHYWKMRSHGIPCKRLPELERWCEGMLAAQYGREGAAFIRQHSINPIRLVINKQWERRPADGWGWQPPMLAVPLKQTEAQKTYDMMQRAHAWVNKWVWDGHAPVLQTRQQGGATARGEERIRRAEKN